MRPEIQKLLYDAKTACEAIEQFTQGKSYDDFAGDGLIRSAVERQLMIVGEALFQASRIEPGLSEEISDLRKIINLRHIIVHGYSSIRPEMIWEIIRNDVAGLHREIETLLKS